MERAPSDEALTETIKTLILSRKCPMTVTQLKQDYEEIEGKSIPELKLQSLMKYNAVFHMIKPVNGEPERFDVRYDARNRMMNRNKPQKNFISELMQRSLKNPVVPRNRYTVTINNNNNNYQKNFNNDDGPTPLVDLRQKLNRKPVEPLAPMPKLTMPLSERLKKRGTLSPEDIEAANAVKMRETWHTSGASYEKLLKYCEIHNLEAPEIKFLNNPLAKGSFKCQVSINGRAFIDPDFFQTKEDAKEACCKVAVQELIREEELLKNPLDEESDAEIVKKIWTMVRGSVGGVFIKHITTLYTDTYKLSLPAYWHQMVKQHDGKLFNFETNAFNEPIIFSIGDVDRSLDGVPDVKVTELVYPWETKLWNVFVTSVFSTNDICARLIGKNYSDALDKLLIEIEITMMTERERPAEIQLNHIYLTSISECYHRIKVVEISGQKANCICVDNGDYEWIDFDDIYVCRPEFLTLAPQAFKLSLFGLEDFENDPNVAQQPLLNEPLILKSLVGEVMIDKAFWASNKTKPIKMILYDTSTDEDVNLNESLMNSILSSISSPALHQKDNNQVIISCVGEDAIYCQLVQSSVYIQQLIDNINKKNLFKHRGLYVDKADKKKFYLVYDAKSKTWFRARLERLNEETQLMYFVDHGYKASVKLEDIYRLDKVSMVLFFYPPQVIKFSLFNVQLNADVRKRLLALLPKGRQALVSKIDGHHNLSYIFFSQVKVVTMGTGNLPLVQLFTYISHNEDKIMIKINDQFATSLGTELENFR